MPITNYKLPVLSKVEGLISNILNFYLTILIPLLYVAILYITYHTPNTFPQNEITKTRNNEITFFSLIITFIGLTLWLTCYYYLKNSFGVLPRTPKKIIKSGPYKYMNHPMYIAIFLTFTGLALANQSLYGFLTNLLILTPVNFYRGHQETKQLH